MNKEHEEYDVDFIESDVMIGRMLKIFTYDMVEKMLRKQLTDTRVCTLCDGYSVTETVLRKQLAETLCNRDYVLLAAASFGGITDETLSAASRNVLAFKQIISELGYGDAFTTLESLDGALRVANQALYATPKGRVHILFGSDGAFIELCKYAVTTDAIGAEHMREVIEIAKTYRIPLERAETFLEEYKRPNINGGMAGTSLRTRLDPEEALSADRILRLNSAIRSCRIEDLVPVNPPTHGEEAAPYKANDTPVFNMSAEDIEYLIDTVGKEVVGKFVHDMLNPPEFIKHLGVPDDLATIMHIYLKGFDIDVFGGLPQQYIHTLSGGVEKLLEQAGGTHTWNPAYESFEEFCTGLVKTAIEHYVGSHAEVPDALRWRIAEKQHVPE